MTDTVGGMTTLSPRAAWRGRLRRGRLREAKWMIADLSRADLTRANLFGANLRWANVNYQLETCRMAGFCISRPAHRKEYANELLQRRSDRDINVVETRRRALIMETRVRGRWKIFLAGGKCYFQTRVALAT